jgi:hypothetical protein
MMSGSMKIVPSNGGSSNTGTAEVVGPADGERGEGEVDSGDVGAAEVVGPADGERGVGEVDAGDPPPLHAELANAATRINASALVTARC